MKSLRQVLESTPPNRNRLHHILSGTILAAVNAGPVALCESFLAKGKSEEQKPEHVSTLKKEMESLLMYLEFAVRMHKGVAGAEHQALHQQYQIKLKELQVNIRSYIGPTVTTPNSSPPNSLASAMAAATSSWTTSSVMLERVDSGDSDEHLDSPDLGRKIRNSMRMKERRRMTVLNRISPPNFLKNEMELRRSKREREKEKELLEK